ncbi:hypothetical protein HTZ54_001276 [Escherichia coli]|nr:hypothetical protein [Escherichia coli]OMI43223.1 hypothetical protein MP33_16680 [Escherichia coli N37058PS]
MFYLVNPAYSGDKYGKAGQGGKNSTHRFKTVLTVFYLIDYAFFLQKNSDRKGPLL